MHTIIAVVSVVCHCQVSRCFKLGLLSTGKLAENELGQ